MRCSHGKPWGHCFVVDCVRRFNHNPNPNPEKGKWPATTPTPEQDLVSSASNGPATSTASEQLRFDEEVARRLQCEDQVETPVASKGTTAHRLWLLFFVDKDNYFVQHHPAPKPRKQSALPHRIDATTRNDLVLLPPPLQCRIHNRYCYPLRLCGNQKLSKDGVRMLKHRLHQISDSLMIMVGNRKGPPCECHVLGSTQQIPVHYRSNQKECLLHDKSKAEKEELKRRIKEIKNGKVKRSRKSTAASKSKSSSNPRRRPQRPRLQSQHLPVLSPSPEPSTPERKDDEPIMTKKQDDDELPMELTEEIEEEGVSKGKAKFTVKVGFARTVKLDAMGGHIVEAVTRYGCRIVLPTPMLVTLYFL